MTGHQPLIPDRARLRRLASAFRQSFCAHRQVQITNSRARPGRALGAYAHPAPARQRMVAANICFSACAVLSHFIIIPSWRFSKKERQPTGFFPISLSRERFTPACMGTIW